MTRFGIALFLAALCAPAQAEQFSITCDLFPGYIMTFDQESKRMIVEVPQGHTFRGSIDSATDDEIRFHLLFELIETAHIWNRTSGVLVAAKAPNDEPKNVCHTSALRPIMSHYDELTF